MKLVLAKDVRFRRILQQGVLIRQAAGEALGINGVGARILQLLVEGRSVPEIVSLLTGEFDVEKRILKEDTNRFVEELLELGVLEPAPGETA